MLRNFSNACYPPDFEMKNRNNVRSRHGIKQHYNKAEDDIPDVVQQCMKKTKENSGIEKLNKCLQESGVPQLPEHGGHNFHERNRSSDGL